ncbi:MAG: hypothetical protein AAFP19_03580 [Bacteroidota bacterium]
MMKIDVQFISSPSLSEAHRAAMWRVYHQYYHYSQRAFMQRINNNNYFAMYHIKGELIGFSGLRINRVHVAGKSRLLIYFGQTIIEKAYRGQSIIPITGAKLCAKYFWELISGKVYFWADALSYKAYLVFAKTLEEYYPNYQSPNTEEINALIDHIGQQFYANSYCPKSQTVKKTKRLVNDATANIYPSDLKDEDIRFYLKANPACRQGHGLITIAPVNRKNIGRLIRRYWSKWWEGHGTKEQKKWIKKPQSFVA